MLKFARFCKFYNDLNIEILYIYFVLFFVIKTILHCCLLNIFVKIFCASSVLYGFLDIWFPGLLPFACARIGYFLVLWFVIRFSISVVCVCHRSCYFVCLCLRFRIRRFFEQCLPNLLLAAPFWLWKITTDPHIISHINIYWLDDSCLNLDINTS
jgi:hypothetical protein